jgi:hypothetical protein
VIRTTKVSNLPTDVNASKHFVFVKNAADNTDSALDLKGKKILATIEVEDTPNGVNVC